MNIIANDGISEFKNNIRTAGDLARALSNSETANFNAGNTGVILIYDTIHNVGTININNSGIKLADGTTDAPTDGEIYIGGQISNFLKDSTAKGVINLYNGTLTLAKENYLNDTQNLNLHGGVLNLINNEIGTVTVNDFSSESPAKLNIDANLQSGTNGYGLSDSITISGTLDTSSAITLNAINVIRDGDAEHLTIFNNQVSPTILTTTTYTNGGYSYTFTANPTIAGVVDVVKGEATGKTSLGDAGFYAAVNDTAANRAFSATADVNMPNIYLTMAGTDATLTIFGNKHNFNAQDQIIVSDGNTLNIYNVGSASEDGTVLTSWNGGKHGVGGAIKSTGTLNIHNSVFTNNHATTGSSGAIKAYGTLNISDSVFSGNSSLQSDGGAMFIDTNSTYTSTEAVISNTKFTGNTAVDGGALGMNDNGSGITVNLVINSSYFSGNTATGLGGAIIAASNGGTTGLEVYSSEFSGNTAKTGSAISISNSNLTIENTKFTSNTASGYGTVYLGSGATANITGSEFKSNTANDGSAIYASATAVANISNTVFDSNNALTFGTVRNEGNMTISDSTFKENTAKSASAISNIGSMVIRDSKFISNSTSDADISAALYNAGELTIYDSSFENNTTLNANLGGAIYNNGKTLNLVAENRNVKFSGNTAGGVSNGITNNGGTINLNGTQGMKIVFDDKIATVDGSTNNILNINSTPTGAAGSAPDDAGTAVTVYLNNNIQNHAINHYAGSLVVADDSYLNTNSLNLAGGMLDIANGKLGNVVLQDFSVTKDSKINFDANLVDTGAGFGTSDLITINGTASGSANLAINAINVLADGDAEHIRLFADSSKAPTISALKTYTNYFVYAYTQNASDRGVLDITATENKSGAGGLYEAVRDTTATRSFSAVADVTLDKALEPMGGTTLNVFGNQHNINGGGFSGFVTAAGQELNFYNVGKLNEDGTVAASLKGFTGESTPLLNNAGTTGIYDTVIAGNSQTSLTTTFDGLIKNTGKLIISGSAIGAAGADNSNIANGIHSGIINNAEDAVLEISASSFANNEISMENTNDYGGVITNYGSVSVANSVFGGQTADSGNITSYQYGAAIANTASGSAEIKNSYFMNNKSPVFNMGVMKIENSVFGGGTGLGNDGGSRNTGSLTITSSEFSYNTTSTKGAVFQNGFGGTMVLEDSVVKNNAASNDGGFLNNDGTLTVSGTKFTANTSGGNGGVFMLNGGSQLNLSDSEFDANSAYIKGGAISIAQTDSKAYISNSTFKNNESSSSAGDGGAINISGNSAIVEITDSSFTGNKSGRNGGAIYNEAQLTIISDQKDTIFKDNISNSKQTTSKSNDIHNTGTLTFRGAKNTSINGGISGSGSILKEETGSLILKGLNSEYTGTTSINAGKILFDKTSADDSYLGGITTINNGGALEFKLAVDDALVSGAIAGTGDFLKTGAATLTLTGDNSAFTGKTTISDGKILFISDSADDKYFAGTTEIAENKELIYQTDIESDFSAILSGAGILRKTGDETLNVAGAQDTFTGKVMIDAGKLLFSYNSDADKFFGGTTTVNSGGELEYSATADGNLDSDIVGTGIFSKTGTGITTLLGENDGFTGTVNVKEGTLAFSEEENKSFFGAASINVGAEAGKTAKLDYSYNYDNEFTKTVNLTGNGTFKNNSANGSTVTISGDVAMSGENNLLQYSGGTFVFNNSFANLDTTGTNNLLSFDNTTAKMSTTLTSFGSSALNAELNNSVLDMTNFDSSAAGQDFTGEMIFNNLEIKGNSGIKVDLDLKNNPDQAHPSTSDPESDRLVVGAGSTGEIELSSAGVVVDGLWVNKEIQIITGDGAGSGGVTIKDFGSYLSATSNNYIYGLELNNEKTGVIISTLDYNNPDSLKVLHNGSYQGTQYENRVFTFSNQGTNNYVILSNLGNMGKGNFVVNGESTETTQNTLNGNNLWSMFLIDSTDGDARHFEISDVSVINTTNVNDAGRNGSAIALIGENSTAKVSNVNFDNNLSTNGGAIFNDAGKANWQNGTYDETTADNENMIIQGSTFVNNTANASGGAIKNEGILKIGSSVFSANSTGLTAGNGGGSIDNTGLLKVNGSQFLNDGTFVSAYDGGAIRNTGDYGDARINKSIFDKNSVTHDGGAIYNSAEMTISDATFTGNKAGNLGGAIYNSGSLTLDANETDVTFSANTAAGSANDIYTTGDLTVKGGYNTVITGGIAGSGSITKDGTGSLQLKGDNSGFNGTTALNSGKIEFTADGNSKYLNGTTTIARTDDANYGTLEFNVLSEYTLGNDVQLEGAGMFSKKGAADLLLTGNHSAFEGTTSIENGRIVFNQTSDTDKYFGGTTDIGASGALVFNISGAISQEMSLTGTGDFIKTGNGALTISGALNTFKGDTDIQTGKLIYEKSDAADSYLGGSTTISSGASLEFNIAAGLTEAIKGGITGATGTSLSKTGAGVLEISGNNSTFAGVADVSNGTLLFKKSSDSDKYFGGSTLVNAGGTLEFDVSRGFSETINGNINGTGDFVKSGEGNVELKGDNSAFTGDTVIEKGKLTYLKTSDSDKYFGGSTEIQNGAVLEYRLNGTNADLAGNNSITGDGTFLKSGTGVLNLSGSNNAFTGVAQIQSGKISYVQSDASSYFGGMTQIDENGVLDFTNNSDDNLNGLSGTGDFNKLGTGILSLTGDNSAFTGSVNINNGTLSYEKSDAGYKFFGDDAEITIADGAALDFDLSFDETINGGIIGSEKASIQKNGTADLIVKGDNSSFEGTTTIHDGSIIFNKTDVNESYFAGNTVINQNGALEFNLTADAALSGTLSGSGTFIKSGNGTLELTGSNNSFSGNTVIESGTISYVQSENGSYFGGSTEIAAGAKLDFENDYVDNIKELSGSGELNKTGSGKLNLTGDNSGFGGDLNIKEGILSFNKNGSDAFISGNANISSGAELVFNLSQSETLAGGQIQGEGTFTKSGSADLNLSGDNSGFSGTVNIASGNMNYTQTGDSKYFGGTTNISGGTLNFENNIADENLTISGGNGVLNKTGSETLNLVGDNSGFTGDINIKEGTLAFNDLNNKFVQSEINIQGSSPDNTANLVYTANSDNSFDNTVNLNGNASVTISGVGSNTISVTNPANTSGNNNTAAYENADFVFDNSFADFGTTGTGNTLSVSNGSFSLGENTKNFGNSSLNANFNDVTIDLHQPDDSSSGLDTLTFNDLNVTGNTSLNIDLDLKGNKDQGTPTTDNPESDKIVYNQGSGTIDIGTINIYKNGEWVDKEITVLEKTGTSGGEISIGQMDPITVVTSSDYEYEVKKSDNAGKLVISTTDYNDDPTGNEQTLKKAHIGGGSINPDRQFIVDSETPVYKVLSDLGTMGEGKFTVSGQGAANSTITGNDLWTLFNVDSTDGKDREFILSNVTVSDAHNDGDGSALIVNGSQSTAKVENAALKDNFATGDGGAVANDNGGKLDIKNSELSGNESGKSGGAISNKNGAQTTISGSQINNNTAGENGGAIYNESAEITITDSSFDGNHANSDGGAIYNNNGTVSIIANAQDVNFTDNTSGSGANDIFMTGADAKLNISGDKNVNITGGIAGEGSIVKDNGSGTLNLSGNNSAFSGTTEINDGTIKFNKTDGNDSYLGGTTTINNGGTLDFNLAVDETLSGGKIFGDGDFQKSGTGTLTVSGDNSGFTGDTTITGGSIIFDKQTENDIYFGGNTSIESGAELEFALGADETISGTISGNGTFTKSGDSSNLTVTGDNSGFKGTTVIEGGTITFDKNSADDKYFAGSTQISQGSSLIYDLAENETISGTLSGNGVFEKTGAADLTVNGNNTGFDGTVKVTEGNLVFDKNTQSDLFFKNTEIGANGSLTYDLDLADTINGSISGTGSFNKTGNGTLTVTGDNSAFAGETAIDKGAIVFDKQKAEDSYFAGNTTINADGKLVYKLAVDEQLSGTISGTGIFEKSGTANFVVSGDNSDFSGKTLISSGTLTFNQNSDADKYFAGSTEIASGAILNYNNSIAGTIQNVSGSGIFEKNGSGELTVDGANSGFKGTAKVNEGILSYVQNETNSYFGGKTEIAENASVHFENSVSDAKFSGLSGKGDFVKSGTQNLTIDGSSAEFAGTLTIDEGKLTFEKLFNTDSYISGKTQINKDGELELSLSRDFTLTSKIEGDGKISKSGNGILTLSGDNSSFKGDFELKSGTLHFEKGAQYFNAANSIFNSNSTIDFLNQSMDKVSLGNVTLNGVTNLRIEADLAKGTGDFISASSVSGNGSMLISSLAILTDSVGPFTSIPVIDTNGGLSQRVSLASSLSQIEGPIYVYGIAYDPNTGCLNFTGTQGTSPSALSGSVAAQVGGYLAMLESYEEAFANMDMTMLMTASERTAMKLRNKIAAADSNVAFTPTMFPEQNKGAWYRPYTAIETVGLKNGPKVRNNIYGSLFGVDSEIIELKHGFDAVFTGYAGYTGSHQKYENISIYQNGGLLGGTAVFYKGNFFSGFTANAGAMQAEASTSYGRDDITLLTAGIANRTGYNWELFNGKFIVQPNITLSYTFVNTFDYTAKSGVRMSSDPLNAIQVAPGIKFIGNLKNGWQPYARISVVMNYLDDSKFFANETAIPELSVKPYVLYGVGVQKRWGERFTGYLQTLLRSGGRNGIGFGLGFRWTI